ncbi:MAG: HNH endonuclease [Planctomycetaceae bacterium]
MKNRPAIPPEVRKYLRKEVNFGCPKCRKPFLEFHHFDPPYEEEPHFRPEGMIALCPECHRVAGNWDKDKIRQLKSSKNIEKPVRGCFDAWENDRQVIVRLGGNYCLVKNVPLSIGGIPIIRFSKNAETGWLQVSLWLKNKHDDFVLTIEDNDILVLPENVHDLHVTVSKHELKVWIEPDDIGLDLKFKWITLDELEKLISKDRKRSRKAAKRHDPTIFERIQRTIPDLIIPNSSSGIEDGFLKTLIKDCYMVDGKIPMININSMSVYHLGSKIIIKNGIYAGKGFMGGNIAFNINGSGIDLPVFAEYVFRKEGALYRLSNGVLQDDCQKKEFDLETFKKQSIVVDGKKFTNCTFEQCRLVYKGGELPAFSGCNLPSCHWVFDESAANTIRMLHYIYHGFNGGHDWGKRTLEQLFEDVRQSPFFIHNTESQPTDASSSSTAS